MQYRREKALKKLLEELEEARMWRRRIPPAPAAAPPPEQPRQIDPQQMMDLYNQFGDMFGQGKGQMGSEQMSRYGGYAQAAAVFGKFMDAAFDSDSPLGDIGRRNIHWLEDGFRGVKDGVKNIFGSIF